MNCGILTRKMNRVQAMKETIERRSSNERKIKIIRVSLLLFVNWKTGPINLLNTLFEEATTVKVERLVITSRAEADGRKLLKIRKLLSKSATNKQTIRKRSKERVATIANRN